MGHSGGDRPRRPPLYPVIGSGHSSRSSGGLIRSACGAPGEAAAAQRSAGALITDATRSPHGAGTRLGDGAGPTAGEGRGEGEGQTLSAG